MTGSPTEVLAAGSAEPAAGSDRVHPTFITTWSCPYAQRTWIALEAKGLQYTPVFVDLQNKPEWFFKHNPYGRVPTLAWQEPNGKTTSLYESLVVNEYINDLEGPSLLPEDPAQRAHARLLIDQFGVKFGGPFAKVVFGGGESDVADLNSALKWVEGKVAKTEGPLFLGKGFTLVDAAVAPFVLRLRVLEGLTGYKMPTDLPRLSSYSEALLAHPAVAASLAPPESSKPYFEQLLEQYRINAARRKAAAAAAK